MSEWAECHVCQSQEHQPYFAIARGGVFIPLTDDRESYGIIIDRAFDEDDECSVCGHLEELEGPIYLCFACVPQWLELMALSIPSRAKEGDAET